MPGSKLSSAFQSDSFTVYFMHLELKKEQKKDYMKVGQTGLGLGYKMVNKIMCSLEGGYSYFKVVLTYIFKSKGEGLLKTKINLIVSYLLGHDYLP